MRLQMHANRERRVADTFVELADTLVDEFDVIDFLYVLTTRCVELLGVSAAGVLLADPRGHLQAAASSGEEARLVELFEVQHDEGPCLDCYRSGEPVVNADLGEASTLWPRFATQARAAGFVVTHALPLRLRRTVIGALNLFADTHAPLAPDERTLGQAMADAATIGILQHRAVQDGSQVSARLQEALNSRILIEQAKGVLAERHGIHIDEALSMLRNYAHTHDQLLSNVAHVVVEGTGEFTGQPGEAPGASTEPQG
jgi:hypothetical protein